MGIKVDLVNRTVENTGSAQITVKEFIEKSTVIDPGQTINLDPDTEIIEA